MGIKFFKKNILDLDNSNASITVTDSVGEAGSDFTIFMQNRDNVSGWMTTGSSDAANTKLVVDFKEPREFDFIALAATNIKSYTLKKWNGSAFVDFDTPIDVTNNAKSTISHSFASLEESQKLELVIRGTQTANEDKFIRQFIVAEKLGEFSIQPEISPEFDKQRKVTRFNSGRVNVTKNVGGFLCDIKHTTLTNANDLSLMEKLFNSYEPFLIWLCGGDISQYPSERLGYRLEDFFLMTLTNELETGWMDGVYKNGIPLNMKLAEVN